MKRVLLAGLLGGIGMFVWSSVAHMVLPLGMIGMQMMPNEQAVLGPLAATLGNANGMYIFPGMDLKAERGAAMQEYEKKLAANPSGLLIYHPPGAKPMTPGQLVVEFLKEVLQAFLAAWLLSKAWVKGYGARVGFVAVIGLAAAMTTSLSYWNWYGFPGDYTLSYMTMEFVGYVVAGAILAKILKGDEWKEA